MGAAVTTAKRWIRTLQEARQKKTVLERVREYRGFVSVLHESDDFRVCTAQTGRDLLQVLKMRHEIFVEEWQGRRAYHRLDVDNHDFTADHLMIIDKRSEDVVGTYRLKTSHFTHDFYSASEFHLGEFLRLPAVKLELGRACVRAAHRNGNTIDLLWKGLSQYVQVTKTEFLFGCSSVKSVDPLLMSRLYRDLHEHGQWSDEYHIRPTPDYQFPGFLAAAADPLTSGERRELLPPLLRSYLHAGALVYGRPALDRDFACADLLTVLDWKKLNPRFQSRFMAKG